MPWSKKLAVALARWKLRGCEKVGAMPRVIGKVVIHGEGRVYLGDRVVFEARSCPIELRAFPGAEIRIGNDVLFEAGVSVEAQESVHIGDRCVIGRFAKILDNHFHPLRGDRHGRPASQPVVLEEGVEIGPMTVVLPGALIPRGSLVGAGKVISHRAQTTPTLVPTDSK